MRLPALLLFVATPFAVSAQRATIPAHPAAGDEVVLAYGLSYDAQYPDSLRRIAPHHCDPCSGVIAQWANGGVVINGDPDWAVHAVPQYAPETIIAVERDSVSGDTFVHLGFGDGVDGTVVMPTRDVAQVWPLVAVPAADEDSLRAVQFARIDALWFGSAASGLPASARERFIGALCNGSSSRCGSVGHDGHQYLGEFVDDQGEFDQLYATPPRIPEELGASIADGLRGNADVARGFVPGGGEPFGMAYRTEMIDPVRSAEARRMVVDTLAVYTPFTALAAFHAGRIASQQLVDSSEVWLGARRLHIILGKP